MPNEHDVVADLMREVVPRGVNQYALSPAAAGRLALHLGVGKGRPLFVGESPATRDQAVAFTDHSKSSEVFNRALGGHLVARWNAWPFWQPVKPNAYELRRGAEYVRQVAELIQPPAVYAVGRVAENTCGVAGVACEYVPHPGQDKAPMFVRRIDLLVEMGLV
jgi:hypothetical protein